MGLEITLDRQPPLYAPGEMLAGEVRRIGEAAAGRWEVLWYTQGGGAPDVGVVASGPLTGEVTRFEVSLPVGPLSFEGRLFEIRWAVRARVGSWRAPETTFADFQLGAVAARSAAG